MSDVPSSVSKMMLPASSVGRVDTDEAIEAGVDIVIADANEDCW